MYSLRWWRHDGFEFKIGFFLGVIKSSEKADTMPKIKNIVDKLYFNDLSSIFF